MFGSFKKKPVGTGADGDDLDLSGIENIPLGGDPDPSGEDDIYQAFGQGRPNGTSRSFEVPDKPACPPVSRAPTANEADGIEQAESRRTTAQWVEHDEIDPQIVEMGRNILHTIEIEEKILGRKYTDEEHAERRLHHSLEAVRQYLAAQTREAEMDAHEELAYQHRRELQQLDEKLARIADSADLNPLKIARDFQREHPFLAGFLGAELVGRLTKR